jgi:hypothetical protein
MPEPLAGNEAMKTYVDNLKFVVMQKFVVIIMGK